MGGERNENGRKSKQDTKDENHLDQQLEENYDLRKCLKDLKAQLLEEEKKRIGSQKTTELSNKQKSFEEEIQNERWRKKQVQEQLMKLQNGIQTAQNAKCSKAKLLEENRKKEADVARLREEVDKAQRALRELEKREPRVTCKTDMTEFGLEWD